MSYTITMFEFSQEMQMLLLFIYDLSQNCCTLAVAPLRRLNGGPTPPPPKKKRKGYIITAIRMLSCFGHIRSWKYAYIKRSDTSLWKIFLSTISWLYWFSLKLLTHKNILSRKCSVSYIKVDVLSWVLFININLKDNDLLPSKL